MTSRIVAAVLALITVHSTTIRWVSVPVGRDSTTVPITFRPLSARIGTATVSRPAAG